MTIWSSCTGAIQETQVQRPAFLPQRSSDAKTRAATRPFLDLRTCFVMGKAIKADPKLMTAPPTDVHELE